jgi:hypothetical protein
VIRTLIGAFFVVYEIAAYVMGWRLVSEWTGPARYVRDAWLAELRDHFERESR